MISLRLLMLVLLTLGCREWAQADPLAGPLATGLSALGVALGFGLLFKMAALRMLPTMSLLRDTGAESSASQYYSSQRCSQARERLEAVWVLCLPLALLATGWGSALVSLREAGLPQVIELVGWYLPSLFLLVLLELTAAQFDALCSECEFEVHPTSQLSGKLELQLSATQLLSWPREFLLRIRLGRMASLLTCLVPVLLVAAVSDIVKHFADNFMGTRILLATMLLTLGCVVLFLPNWLCRWMGANAFPQGELRERIASQLQRLRLRGVELRLLSSRGRWPGAAIVGWFPGFRQLWLGDALIDRLTPRQVDMVVMHELAHIIGWHFLWRVFPMLWGVGVVALFGIFWPVAEELHLIGTLVSSILACVVMLIGMSAMAHQCELDADLSACALAEQVCEWAWENPGQAREELAAALIRLLGDSPQAAEASWLHPSLRQRLTSLARQGRSVHRAETTPSVLES